jgi:3-hydroxyacyl-CoA dehydrogenase
MQKIGIVGAGAMGTGIAQVAAQAGMDVCVYDLVQSSLDRANQQLQSTMEKRKPYLVALAFQRIFMRWPTKKW